MTSEAQPTIAGSERLGVLLYTHDHVDDVKVAMELVRTVWTLPKDPYLVHAYNGPEVIYPEPYLEDERVRRVNLGHFAGAADLIDAGLAALLQREDVRHAVVLACDTWLLSSSYVVRLVDEMRRRRLRVAAATWGYPEWSDPFENGLSADFFVVDLEWAREFSMFPLDYAGFEQRYGELLAYLSPGNVSVEKLLMTRLLQASFRETPDNVNRLQVTIDNVRLMTEREPIHLSMNDPGDPGGRRPQWPDLRLYTQDRIDEKRDAMRAAGVPADSGPAIARLLEASDLGYFNRAGG